MWFSALVLAFAGCVTNNYYGENDESENGDAENGSPSELEDFVDEWAAGACQSSYDCEVEEGEADPEYAYFPTFEECVEQLDSHGPEWGYIVSGNTLTKRSDNEDPDSPDEWTCTFDDGAAEECLAEWFDVSCEDFDYDDNIPNDAHPACHDVCGESRWGEEGLY